MEHGIFSGTTKHGKLTIKHFLQDNESFSKIRDLHIGSLSKYLLKLLMINCNNVIINII